MGGLVLDILVGYVITFARIIRRTLRARKTAKWNKSSAKVVGASYESSPYMPRPVAKIAYTYRIDEELYGGVDEKPFFEKDSAKRYAGRFVKGDTIAIRVNPSSPEVSAVRDEDQTGSTGNRQS